MTVRRKFQVLTVAAVTAAVAVIGSSLALAASTAQDATQSTQAAAQAKKLRVAWVGADFTNPLYASIRAEALKRAKQKKVTLLTTGSNDPTTQINAMQTYIGQKVDVLGMSALNQKGALAVVKQANKARIPVIAVHGPMPGAKVATTITLAWAGLGKTMGRQIVDYCTGRNPCKVALFVGDRADDISVLIQNNVTNTIKNANASNIEVVSNPATGFDPQQASSATTDVLTQHPDIDVLWYVWSAGVLAGAEAVQAAGKAGDVALFSASGTCQMLQFDLQGRINGDVMILTEYEGTALVDSAIKAKLGQKLPKQIAVPTFAITPARAKAVLAGTLKPPAAIAASVVRRLRQAAAGNC